MNKVSLAEAGDGSPPFWRRYVVEDFINFGIYLRDDSQAHIQYTFHDFDYSDITNELWSNP